MFENAGAVMGNTPSAREAAQMGAYNKGVRTDNAAGWVSNLNAETQKYDQILNAEARKALNDPNYVPLNFNSREEFQNYYNTAKTERDRNNFYSPSTIQRGFGSMDANTYRNVTGYAPYILGRGKRLAENESVPVDITTEDGAIVPGYKPVVRTLRQDGSGNVQLYNADTTWGGGSVAEIAKEGGPDAVAASTLDAMPYSVEDQDFYGYMSGLLQRANMRRDTAYMDTVDGGTAELDLDAPSREANEERLLNIAVDQGLLSEEEAQARLDTARQQRQQQAQTRTSDTAGAGESTAETGDFASLEDFNTSEKAWISVWANQTRGFDRDSVDNVYYGSAEADARRKEAIRKAAEQYTNDPEAAAAIGITKELGEEAVKLSKGFTASGEAVGEDTTEQHLKFGDEPEGKVWGFDALSKRLPIYVGALERPSAGRGGAQTKRMLAEKYPEYAGDWVQDFRKQPYPFGISQRQFESGTIKQGENAMRAAKVISEFNVDQALYDKTDQLRGHWLRLNLTDPEIVNRLEYLEGDAFTPGVKGLTEVERAEIDVVKKFYGEQTSNRQLKKIFLENPEAFKEYYADPYNFAIKYSDNMQALVPPTITPQDKINAGVNPSNVNKIDADPIIKIAETAPVITQEHILTLEREVEKLGTVRAEAQEKLANFLEEKDKRVNDLSKQERAFFVTNWMAATDKDDPLYRVLASTFPVFMQTGDYSTWEEEMRLKWAQYEQEEERIAIAWSNNENAGQSNLTSLLNYQLNFKKYTDLRTSTFNDGSAAGQRYSQDREGMAFYTNWKDGLVNEITVTQAAPFMNSISTQARELASNIAQGVFGQEQAADLRRVQADISLVMKTLITNASNDNKSFLRKVFSFFGADFDVDPNGFEINRKVMGLDAQGKMTDNPDEIATFHIVNDASLAPEGNPMSRAELQGAFGGDAGIQNLMAIVIPTNALRRSKGLE